MRISSIFLDDIETPVIKWSECDDCCYQTIELSNKPQVAAEVLEQLKTLADICDKADISFEELCQQASTEEHWYALIGSGGPPTHRKFTASALARAQELAAGRDMMWVAVRE